MKNKIKILLLLLSITILIFYFVYKFTIKEHSISYTIDKYNINEDFYINEEHNYDITIKNNNNEYNILLTNNLNKKKKIIKEIKKYKSNNLECIIPQYIKYIDPNIYCCLDNKQVSTDYLIKSENEDFNTIMKKVKKYKIKYPRTDNKKKAYKKIDIYTDNIEYDEIIYVWDYKGIYILDNYEFKYQKILDYDLYDNLVSVVVDNYYVLFENTSVNGIENIYYYNYNNNKLKTYKLKEKISKNTYINGVVDKLIYITDKDKKKQYTINIKKEKKEQIDYNQTKYITFKDEKEKCLSKSDFFMNDQVYTNSYIENKEVTESKELKEDKKYYYYIEDSKFYRVIKTNINNPTLLFELDGIKEWFITNENIYLISNGILYKYNDQLGLNKVIESNELKYNYKNICKIGRK